MADTFDLFPLHQEHTQITNKDGAFTASEKKRLAELEQIFAAEPALQKLLIDLEKRQEKERVDSIQQQRRAPSPGWGNAHDNLGQRHDAERQRYIKEFHDAKAMREELQQSASCRRSPKKAKAGHGRFPPTMILTAEAKADAGRAGGREAEGVGAQ